MRAVIASRQMTSSETLDRIAHFIDDVVLPRLNPLPGVPVELRGDWSSGDGWYSWIAIDSPVSDDDMNDIERDAGISLPPLFRAYFLYKQMLDGDYGLVRLPDMDPSDPLGNLRSQIAVSSDPNCPALSQNNLLPFGQDGNDGGPICFKTDQPTDDGDFPVYFADHELLSDPSYSGKRVWDTFGQLLKAIETDILSYR